MADSPMETRRNVLTVAEIRETDTGFHLDGLASTYNEPYPVGYFDERVATGAFDRTMNRDPDVRLLVDHEGQPLGRTSSGTLLLDHRHAAGYRAQSDLEPSDPDVQRLVPKMRRGDLNQMSFAFRVPDGGDMWDYAGDRPLRTLREINMQGGDVSIVTYPANPGTMASLRSDRTEEASWVLANAMLRDRSAGHTFDKATLRHLHAALDGLGLVLRDVRDPEHFQHLRQVGDSFNDTQQALRDALQAKYGGDDGDEPFDLWVQDAGDDWVVFTSYGDAGPGRGTWRIGYTVTDGSVTIADGDPEKVAVETSYQPVQMNASKAINDLPDSDFAYIESGGEKDDEGKTTPRSLRHFPIHDAAHVRNALARMGQSPFGEKAKPKILAAAKKFDVEVSEENSGIPAGLALRLAEADVLRRNA